MDFSSTWEQLLDVLGLSQDEAIESCPNCKRPSEKACKRLKMAQEAVQYTKSKFPNGAGNQYEELKESNTNSLERLKVARDKDEQYFEINEEVLRVSNSSLDANIAFLAAKAELSGGGNCGEHALVAYDNLRVNYPNDKINYVSVHGVDHAFVIIGDIENDDPDDLVVADAWPTEAGAVTWNDHFLYKKDKSKVNITASAHTSKDFKKEFVENGMSLNTKGQKMVGSQLNDKDTKDYLDTQTSKSKQWIWTHPNAYGEGKNHKYECNE